MSVSGKQEFSVIVGAAEIKMNEMESTCSSNLKTPWNVTGTAPGQGLGSKAPQRALKWFLQSTRGFNCLYYSNSTAPWQGQQKSRSPRDKPSCSGLIWGQPVVLLRCFKGIGVKPSRVFFKSGIFPFLTALEVPVESLSKPMSWLSPNTLVGAAFCVLIPWDPNSCWNH